MQRNSTHKIELSFCLGGERKRNGFMGNYPEDPRCNSNVIFHYMSGGFTGAMDYNSLYLIYIL